MKFASRWAGLALVWGCAAQAGAAAGAGDAATPDVSLVDSTGSDATEGPELPDAAGSEGAGEDASDLAAGDGPDLGGADGEPACNAKPELEWLEQEYFAGSCTFSSCHSAKKKAGGLVLEPGKARASLVGIPALNLGAKGQHRVKPGDPDGSYLLRRVSQDLDGGLMPLGATEPVDPCAIEALRKWIAAGAP